jgi:hypothetical protein
MSNILKPLEAPFPTDIARALSTYPQGKDGYILKLFRVFANSTRFLTKKGALNLLDKESPMSLREREIIILRTTANLNCEYEWGVHVATFAKAANLNDQQVMATRNSSPAVECWTPKESLLIECVDQLCAQAMIEDRTYAQFQKTWSLEQQLEIFALCGNYHLISFVANTTRIELEANAARF